MTQVTGTVHFSNQYTVFLLTDEGLVLLVIDVPPFGSYDITDIAAAANLMLHLGKVEGSLVTLLGFFEPLPSGDPAFLISRVLANEQEEED